MNGSATAEFVVSVPKTQVTKSSADDKKETRIVQLGNNSHIKKLYLLLLLSLLHGQDLGT